MSDTVIKVENLGKKYIIGHQKQERYTALRDVVAEGVRSIVQFFRRNGKREAPYHEEFWALKDVSFEAKRGDQLNIIFCNGEEKLKKFVQEFFCFLQWIISLKFLVSLIE
jgi:lipopolysaccharide transport system ATP-binding protein